MTDTTAVEALIDRMRSIGTDSMLEAADALDQQSRQLATTEAALKVWQQRAAELEAELAQARWDTERLDWLIAQQAWIQWTLRDGSIRQCQVYDQDEDEDYHILSGDDRYFNAPRDAIDAAIAASKE